MNSKVTVCFALIMMCFPFYNNKSIFNLLDTGHEVIKNDSETIVARDVFNEDSQEMPGY